MLKDLIVVYVDVIAIRKVGEKDQTTFSEYSSYLNLEWYFTELKMNNNTIWLATIFLFKMSHDKICFIVKGRDRENNGKPLIMLFRRLITTDRSLLYFWFSYL